MKNKLRIMTFKKFISYFKLNESSNKERRLNDILDRINKGSELNKNDKEFLDNFETTSDADFKDYKMLTDETAFSTLNDLLESNRKIICNLNNRDGKIGIQIKSVSRSFESEKTFLVLTNNDKIELRDNFLYDINYNSVSNEWFLEEVDEFYEKIPIKK
jgi:Icc-related predicted phosphoesterase